MCRLSVSTRSLKVLSFQFIFELEYGFEIALDGHEADSTSLTGTLPAQFAA
jgi:hypothetical protein